MIAVTTVAERRSSPNGSRAVAGVVPTDAGRKRRGVDRGLKAIVLRPSRTCRRRSGSDRAASCTSTPADELPARWSVGVAREWSAPNRLSETKQDRTRCVAPVPGGALKKGLDGDESQRLRRRRHVDLVLAVRIQDVAPQEWRGRPSPAGRSGTALCSARAVEAGRPRRRCRSSSSCSGANAGAACIDRPAGRVGQHVGRRTGRRARVDAAVGPEVLNAIVPVAAGDVVVFAY